MPNSAQIQADRQEAICQILRAGSAGTQRFLVEELTALGFEATQSSVSRDLKDIGAVKTVAGYELPSRSHSAEDEIANVADLLRGLKPAGPNLLVIKTAIGAAQRVALVLDRCCWPEIVGNVGGDDTVFVATGNASAQKNLISKIERASARA
jgi:transcriptional regulator of arginine metabolism